MRAWGGRVLRYTKRPHIVYIVKCEHGAAEEAAGDILAKIWSYSCQCQSNWTAIIADIWTMGTSIVIALGGKEWLCVLENVTGASSHIVLGRKLVMFYFWLNYPFKDQTLVVEKASQTSSK